MRKRETACEAAAFVRSVSIGMHHKTIRDVNNGFGDRAAACREHTLPREDPNSRINAMIPGQTTIGPVLQVHVTRCLHVSGIEIQIPPQRKRFKIQVVFTKGNNRYVEELRLNDPDHNPRSSELVNHKGMERPMEIKKKTCPAKTEI